MLCLYCLLDYEHLEGRDSLDLSLYAQGLAVLVWVSSGADSKTSIQVQVVYLGDGPRELGRWSQRTLGGNRGGETAEGEKPISVLSSKLPVLLENLGDTVEHVPVLSPERVEELGIYPPPPHLLLVKHCSQGHELPIISDLFSSQVKCAPIT